MDLLPAVPLAALELCATPAPGPVPRTRCLVGLEGAQGQTGPRVSPQGGGEGAQQGAGAGGQLGAEHPCRHTGVLLTQRKCSSCTFY